MNAQCYTNKRRILAEAAITKVQYNKGVTVNKIPISGTINCNPNFEIIVYTPINCCIIQK